MISLMSDISSSVFYSLFPRSHKKTIFELMKKVKHNYIKFSFEQGNPQVQIVKSESVNLDHFLSSDLKIYEESYIFNILKKFNHESLHFIRDDSSELKSIIAIHNTVLGKGFATGGTRMWNYNNEGEALLDVLRLSEGMTYKSSIANLAFGGGKAVIIGKTKTEKLLESYGSYLKLLNTKTKAKKKGGGKYQPLFITGEDVGLDLNDIVAISQTGADYLIGHNDESSDPSILTAQGVVVGIEATVNHTFGSKKLEGLSIHVQGLGNVGSRVVKILSNRGARISVYDRDIKKANDLLKRFGVILKSSKQIVQDKCDIFSPCALGSVVNAQTINQFHCKIIAGAANNQLAESKYGNIIKEKGILYAPDYVINSGGVISVARDFFLQEEKIGEKWALNKVKEIYDILTKIFKIAEKEDIGTHEAADQIAKQYIKNAIRKNKNTF